MIKVTVILSIGAMVGYGLACLMLESGEHSRQEEILLKREMSIDRKYEGDGECE